MEPIYDILFPKQLSGNQLDYLLAHGWYRMHQTVFTISHLDTGLENRVYWLRMPVRSVTETRQHRRIRKAHAGMRWDIGDFTSISDEHEELYARYRRYIDFDGARSIRKCLFGQDPPAGSIFQTKVISIYDGDRLVAGGYFDLGTVTAASILHFFDPEMRKGSPGKFMILLTIDYLRAVGMDWYYPGYLVAGNPKMDYKLFLGREITEYYDQEKSLWLPFDEKILLPDGL